MIERRSHTEPGTAARRIYRAVAVLVLNTLIIFTGFELVARGALVFRSTVLGASDVPPDPRSASSFYRTVEWASRYWDEFPRSRKQQYHAYTIWRRAPFQGETINVDAQGLRRTPGSECTADALRVFLFGGSPVWGTGAPDWGTVAAFLRRDLHEQRRVPVCLQNFGESGYVSTQSVIELELQLQAGHVPDIAIFADGVNDVYMGYQSGRAGVHQNLQQISARFEGADRPTLPAHVLDSSAFYSFIANRVRWFGAQPSPALTTYASAGIAADDLSNAIVHTYLRNYQIVDALAKKFHFRYKFVWPPYISEGRKPLTAEEKLLAAEGDPDLKRLYASVYRKMQRPRARYPHLYSLTDTFDGYPDLLWLDDTHVTPLGNELLARRILRIIESEPKRSLDGAWNEE